ncbi:hypothetical protein IVB30_36460 [Bradyrhizobium sp. 200]|uniref:hypothetical protein n=1 Tax=Bradyrhizobium sp. 200 TaxID=2782665 RepID=UPI001FFEC61D|nr:hypothetical protein [Bradyrhizobium sp. 200]UPJ48488.1 hypothetical protein IVB30_36460 [Bradyrhizobium sp. 200]
MHSGRLFGGRGDQGGDHDAYRRTPLEELRGRCLAAKAVYPERRYIVGIGLDARGVQGASEDLIFIDTKKWTDQEILAAQALRTERGYFKEGNAIISRLSEDEFSSGRVAVDIPKLADEISRLTIAESLELAAMLKARWGSEPTGGQPVEP